MCIRQFTIIVAIFFIFALCSPVAAAKHIIVIYDVSGSMVSLNIGGGGKTYMKSEDIRRVNDYLTDILFKDTSQPLRNMAKDSHLKKCDSAYFGRPLYQSGDVLTYATYTDRRDEKMTRKQVRRDEFYRQLPTKFPGQVSYLDRAEVEVYDELYLNTDDETYWVFVTDGDIDRSEARDPEIRNISKRLVEIEEEFYSPMIFGIFVNTHVKIEVRRIQKRIEHDTVFIANRTVLNEPVKEIQLSKGDVGQLMSETLIIDTRNSDKTKFKLGSVNVEIFDKSNKLLQVAATPISLHGHSPPYEFRISLPENPEIAATGKALKLKVNYNYDGEEKSYSTPLMQYETVIKSVFVIDPEKPDQRENRLILRFSENAYRTTLVVKSESPNKDAFRVENIRTHIEDKNEQKLCDASVTTIPEKLDESFQITVSKVKDLDLYGNRLVLNINYSYEGLLESETIKFYYDRSGESSGFLMVIGVILGVGVFVVLVFVLVRVVKKLFGGSNIEYEIMLGEVEQAESRSNDVHYFTLKDGETLSFGAESADGPYFAQRSSAVIRCKRGDFFLCENDDDEDGQPIVSGETLTLTRDEGNVIHIYFEIVDDDQELESESDYFIDEDDDYLLPD